MKREKVSEANDSEGGRPRVSARSARWSGNPIGGAIHFKILNKAVAVLAAFFILR
jgi:hypothetical protein